MRPGGPHVLPLQQQGIEDNTDTSVTIQNVILNLILQFHPRREIVVESEQESNQGKLYRNNGLK